MLKENQWSSNNDIPLMSKILECIQWTEEDLRQNRTWQGTFRKGTITICRSGGKVSYISQTPIAGKNVTNIIKRGGRILSLNSFGLLTTALYYRGRFQSFLLIIKPFLALKRKIYFKLRESWQKLDITFTEWDVPIWKPTFILIDTWKYIECLNVKRVWLVVPQGHNTNLKTKN